MQPHWQLLQPAVTLSEFEAFPLVKSFFFDVGMQFLRQNLGVLFTERGVVTVTLGFTHPTAFNSRLTYGDAGVETVQVKWPITMRVHNLRQNRWKTVKIPIWSKSQRVDVIRVFGKLFNSR